MRKHGKDWLKIYRDVLDAGFQDRGIRSISNRQYQVKNILGLCPDETLEGIKALFD